jgi:hypothetical protein
MFIASAPDFYFEVFKMFGEVNFLLIKRTIRIKSQNQVA